MGFSSGSFALASTGGDAVACVIFVLIFGLAGQQLGGRLGVDKIVGRIVGSTGRLVRFCHGRWRGEKRC